MKERRRDPRIPATALVRLASRDEPGDRGAANIVVANLLDVSAGGLRASCPTGSRLDVGSEVVVEIQLDEEGDRRAAPPSVDLRGTGVVVRMRKAASDGSDGKGGACVTALRFIGPLTMREPFANMLLF